MGGSRNIGPFLRYPWFRLVFLVVLCEDSLAEGERGIAEQIRQKGISVQKQEINETKP